MDLIPTLQLQNRHCVTLHRGRLDEPYIWHVDPLATARKYREAGARWLHVTDLDALSGQSPNSDLIDALIHGSGLNVQIGGGIRSYDRVAHWIDRGAARVVMGTVAVRAPSLVKQAAKYFPDQIVLAVDVSKGHVLTHGWQEASTFTPEDLIAQFDTDPLAAILVTDIDADIGETDRSLALVTDLARHTRLPTIASGVVRSLDDVARLKYIGIQGALVGRVLLNRDIDLADAMSTAANAPEERTAEFL